MGGWAVTPLPSSGSYGWNIGLGSPLYMALSIHTHEQAGGEGRERLGATRGLGARDNCYCYYCEALNKMASRLVTGRDGMEMISETWGVVNKCGELLDE